jgi:hypothetical protein
MRIAFGSFPITSNKSVGRQLGAALCGSKVTQAVNVMQTWRSLLYFGGKVAF